MKRVFVSYSRNNLDIVAQLVQDIQAVGIDVWHDQTLTGGQRWWDKILANIRECDVFVAALSPDCRESEACRGELEYAVRLNKTILPVLVANGVNVNLLPHPLNEIQVADYRGRDKGAAFALIRSIQTAAPSPPLPDPLPAPPAVPISYLSNLTERIDSREPMDAQDQIRLVFELEAGMRDGRSPVEIRDLLLRLKRRDDLLAKVAVNIDTVLRSIEEKAPQRPSSAVFSAAASTSPQSSGTFVKEQHYGYRSCPRCRAPANTASNFCTGCGASLSESGGSSNTLDSVPDTHTPQVARSKTRRYSCSNTDAPRVIAEVKAWLASMDFDSQQMLTETQSVLLQIKKRGGWRNFVGMATSLNIVFHPSADTLSVEIGAGKWIDKATVGTVSMFVLWPLAVTAGIGAWEQSKLPEKIFDHIGARLPYR
ncbi:MAG: TIR domain-containing protein [Acidobacteriaceae bacterium]|nr:TIR domain-containing protein [Acidobacteriaceae bacterium]